jgi:hypothetical protein
MNILIKFPTRNRPVKFFETLNLYYSLLKNIDLVRFVISMDVDDLTMNNEDIRKKLDAYSNLNYYYSNNNSKIDAINADMIDQNFDILLLASDDMIPTVNGYDQIIIDDMNKYFPNGDGSLWYNDNHQKDKLNTLCIMDKQYYDRFGYIYHPSYKSFYCDNEYTLVGISSNKMIYIDNCIIKHEHPDCNHNVENDVLYKKNNSSLQQDFDNFLHRQKLNFPITFNQSKNERWTFGITTENITLSENGNIANIDSNLKLIDIITSIRNLNIPIDKYEIIIIGNNNYKCDLSCGNIKLIYFDESIKPRWITKKKNIIYENAQFENCVVVHDYIIFDTDWYNGFLSFDPNWDVCMCKILTIDNIRWRDWVLGWDQTAPYTLEHNNVILHKNRLLYSDYDHVNTNMYISGSVIIGKTEFLKNNKLNEDLIWGQGEDDEWSRRCRSTWTYKMNVNSTLKLLKHVPMN